MAKTFSELQALALQIRDEILEKKNTAPRVGAALLDMIDNTIQNITDINQKLSVFEHACSGFKRVESESQLPVTPPQDEKAVGYLVGKNLYLYVGKNGNAANGRYFNVGSIIGPQGEIGPQGIKGLDGKDGVDGKDGRDGERGPQGNSGITGSASDIDVINDLSGGESTPGSIKVLAAEQGKVLDEQSLYGSFKFSEIDNCKTKGIYIREKSEDQYDPTILFVSANDSGKITQTYISSGVSTGQAEFKTRIFENDKWSEWIDFPGLYGSFKFSEIDNCKTKGIYIREKSEYQYDPTILFVSANDSGKIAQTYISSGVSTGQAEFKTRIFENDKWSEWIDYGINDIDKYLKFQYIGPAGHSNNMISNGEGFVLGNTICTIYNPYAKKYNNKLKGQMHCHTVNSDGQHSPSKVCQDYKNLDFDFITITDHNYITPEPEGNELIWIGNSYENTSLAEEGRAPSKYQHICVYDTEDMFLGDESYMYQSNKMVEEIIMHHSIEDNKVCNLAHPDWSALYYPDEALESVIPAFSFVEVFNFADENGIGTFSERAWDILLTRGARVFAIAVDDYHSTELGGGWIEVNCENKDKSSIYKSFAEGNMYAVKGTNGNVSIRVDSVLLDNNTISLTLSSHVNKIEFIGKKGSVLKTDSNVNTSSYTIKGNEKYVRIKITNNEEIVWMQPFFISVG